MSHYSSDIWYARTEWYAFCGFHPLPLSSEGSCWVYFRRMIRKSIFQSVREFNFALRGALCVLNYAKRKEFESPCRACSNLYGSFSYRCACLYFLQYWVQATVMRIILQVIFLNLFGYLFKKSLTNFSDNTLRICLTNFVVGFVIDIIVIIEISKAVCIENVFTALHSPPVIHFHCENFSFARENCFRIFIDDDHVNDESFNLKKSLKEFLK